MHARACSQTVNTETLLLTTRDEAMAHGFLSVFISKNEKGRAQCGSFLCTIASKATKQLSLPTVNIKDVLPGAI